MKNFIKISVIFVCFFMIFQFIRNNDLSTYFEQNPPGILFPSNPESMINNWSQCSNQKKLIVDSYLGQYSALYNHCKKSEDCIEFIKGYPTNVNSIGKLQSCWREIGFDSSFCSAKPDQAIKTDAIDRGKPPALELEKFRCEKNRCVADRKVAKSKEEIQETLEFRSQEEKRLGQLRKAQAKVIDEKCINGIPDAWRRVSSRSQ